MERTYKTMTVAGAGNIAIGVVVLVCGIVCGILTISGARMLKRKSDIIF